MNYRKELDAYARERLMRRGLFALCVAALIAGTWWYFDASGDVELDPVVEVTEVPARFVQSFRRETGVYPTDRISYIVELDDKSRIEIVVPETTRFRAGLPLVLKRERFASGDVQHRFLRFGDAETAETAAAVAPTTP